MAEIEFVDVKIDDIFKHKRGNSKYTRKYCNTNPGEYEVYTGTTIGSFSFIDTYDYNEPLLTYTTDGENAATLKVLRGKYNVGGHRAILFPKKENISIEYIKWTLQTEFFNNVLKGDVPSLTWSKAKKIKASIPITNEGEYDLEEQLRIVEKHKKIYKSKKQLREKLDYIKKVEVEFLENLTSETKSIDFGKLFKIKRGKVISRAYINENPGEYPVYSTQLDEAFGYIDNYMYDGEYLIWNTDGLGGYIRLVDGKFSITNIVGIMELTEDYLDKVSLEYIRRFLQPIFRENTKGREGIQGKNEYTKLNSTMIKNLKIKIDFPVDENHELDLEKQIEIVQKYQLIDDMKKNISNTALSFITSDIDLSK